MQYQTTIVQIGYKPNLEEIIDFTKKLTGRQDSMNKNEIFILEKDEKKQSIGVEDIDRVISWNASKSNSLRLSVIFDAEALTTQAQNSLLKVIEEPAENSMILLITRNYYNLLETIRSRTLVHVLSGKRQADTEQFDYGNFLQLNFIEREKMLSKIIEERRQFKAFTENLMSYLINNKTSYKDDRKLLNMIELLKTLAIASENSVNLSLLLNTLNIELEAL